MKSTIIVAVFMCLSLLGAVGYVVYKEVQKPTKESKQTTVQTTPEPKPTAKSNQGDSVTLGQSTQSKQDTIPLGGQQSTKQQATNQPEILDPSEFEAYDSYVNSDKYLRLDIKPGTGAEAVTGKKVAVYYKGWLTNGEVFDESRPNEAGELQPFVFAPGAGQVITGWEQGILGMKVGGTRRLVLPPAAAYGEAGQGSIPPNAVLIFDIQLLEVEQ